MDWKKKGTPEYVGAFNMSDVCVSSNVKHCVHPNGTSTLNQKIALLFGCNFSCLYEKSSVRISVSVPVCSSETTRLTAVHLLHLLLLIRFISSSLCPILDCIITISLFLLSLESLLIFRFASVSSFCLSSSINLWLFLHLSDSFFLPSALGYHAC